MSASDSNQLLMGCLPGIKSHMTSSLVAKQLKISFKLVILEWFKQFRPPQMKCLSFGKILPKVTVVGASLLELLLDTISSVMGSKQSEALRNISIVRVSAHMTAPTLSLCGMP